MIETFYLLERFSVPQMGIIQKIGTGGCGGRNPCRRKNYVPARNLAAGKITAVPYSPARYPKISLTLSKKLEVRSIGLFSDFNT